MAGPDTLSDLTLIGTHLRLGREAWRDRLFLDEPPLEALQGELRAAGLSSFLLLCTCERVEVLTEESGKEEAIRAWLAKWADVEAEALAPALYRHQGEAALRHLARVAASLDSLVLGEPQVLGQVKEAERAARATGLLSPLLDEVCQTAFAAAKRVRTETSIGQRPVTMAAVALQVARDLHGDLRRCRLLLLGVGETVELFASSFREAGVGQLALAHPRAARGEAAALRLGATQKDWAALERALAEAEIVATGLAGAHYSLSPEMMARVVKARRRRPMLLIDGGIPGDVDPACDALEDLFLYDLEDLERLAQEGLKSRGDSLAEAEAVIDEVLDRFAERRSGRASGALLQALETRLEELRLAAEAEGDEGSATRLARELKHQLASALRALQQESPEEAARAEALLRRLFDVKQDDDGKEPKA
ncbi:glutamyl-tRNA reductase [Limibacillus halophilus]